MSPFESLVKQRRSIRKYLDKPVEREKILTCIEAARLAPSAENIQPWRFLVIDEPELKAEFSRQAFSGIYRPTRWAAKAPVIIVLLAKLDILTNRLGKQIQGIPFYLLDMGIAGEHLVLQAQDLGLGTCWIGWFNSKKVQKFLGIPSTYKIVALISLGYPEKLTLKEKRKKALKEIVWFNGFNRRLETV
ncbi:MAG: nitroreductase family protein [candidate division KSB1 bacterium]|nr:nitroreductase family protein [candidate division KSB1 bacterium]